MDLKRNNDILSLAEKVAYYNDLLINHKWLSAEEGNKNMMKAISERKKSKNRNNFFLIFK